MKRQFFLSAGAMAALLAAATSFADDPQRPNVLILQPDQHRGTTLACAGDSQVHTPHLDRLAAEGIRFSRCASASPVCSPFRGTMQTGLYPHKHGVTQNGRRLAPDLRCLADVFAEAGYATGYIGKWHLDGGTPKPEAGIGVKKSAVGGFVPAERRRGWQEWNGYEKAHEFFEVWKYDSQGRKVRVEGYDWEPNWHNDMALDFARRHRDAGRPWIYYVSYGPPHKPEQCPERFLQHYDPQKFVLPPDIAGKLTPEEETIVRAAWHAYYAQVTAIDHEVGRLLDGLKELGVDSNTIILYTSDHGDRLGSHWAAEPAKKSKKLPIDSLRGKAAPCETAFRIPLIVRWPARIAPNRVCDALVSSVDLVPTILDLAGLPPISGAQGDSMAGWCLEGSGPSNPALWIGLGGWRAAWDGRWTYAWGNYRLLYDHQADPHEIDNRIDDPAADAERIRLHRLLVDLAERNKDPLLDELRKADPAGVRAGN